MGSPVFHRAAALLATVATTAALALAGPASARPCADCFDPDPGGGGGGGSDCPTIAASTDPSIATAGPFKVGQVLVGNRGTWTNAASYQARWFAGGNPVTAATTVNTSTVQYVPSPADRGKKLRLQITAIGSDASCRASEYSEETSAVVAGAAPSPTLAPGVAGEQQVGMPLQGTVGQWSPAPDQFQATWRRGSTQIGTGLSYTPVAADSGATLQLEIRGLRNGHDTGTATVHVGPIREGTAPTVVKAPTIDGAALYGADLRAAPGTWSMAPASVAYQWHRSGATIPGATQATYKPSLADIGKPLSLTVRAALPGYATGVTSVPVGTVQRASAPRWRVAKPRLKGKDKIGKKVRVQLKTAAIRRKAVAPDAAVSFQWLRNGKTLKGQTKRKHRIVKRDKGKRLKVRITVIRPGHHPLVFTTKAVKVRDKGRALG